MYSIVEIQGKQYRVEADQVVRVDRLDLAENAPVEDIKVLLHRGEGSAVKIGAPYVEGVKVKATVLGETRGDKVVAIRYKPKSGYTKTHGHRQRYSLIKIESITA